MAFTTHSKITNASGRIDYLTNEERQEEIVMVIQTEKSFNDYIEYEKSQKNVKNEAREQIFAIPHKYYENKDELKNFIDEVIEKTLPKNTPHLVAVHWNKSRTNLHMHVLYFERQRQTQIEFETYKKDYWIKENGALAIKKDDRFKLIHKKGDFKLDEKGNKIPKNKPFTNKNPYFKSKEFLQNVQDNFRQIMEKRGFSSHKNRFKQVHIGTFKNINTNKIKTYNSNIVKLNKKISEYENKFGVKKADELAIKIKKIPNYTYKIEDIIKNFEHIEDYTKNISHIKHNSAYNQVKNIDYTYHANVLFNLLKFQNMVLEDFIELKKNEFDYYSHPIHDLILKLDEFNKIVEDYISKANNKDLYTIKLLNNGNLDIIKDIKNELLDEFDYIDFLDDLTFDKAKELLEKIEKNLDSLDKVKNIIIERPRTR